MRRPCFPGSDLQPLLRQVKRQMMSLRKISLELAPPTPSPRPRLASPRPYNFSSPSENDQHDEIQGDEKLYGRDRKLFQFLLFLNSTNLYRFHIYRHPIIWSWRFHLWQHNSSSSTTNHNFNIFIVI